MIGLKRGIVKLVPYNPEWAEIFSKDKIELQKVLGQNALGIEHIGSTAIPGIMAKPVIDIAVGISDMDEVEKIKELLEKSGWIWRPKFGDPKTHIVFAKGTDEERTHYLHLMKYQGKEWNEKIFFRDYLRTHEPEKHEYEELKQKAMSEFEEDRKAYTAKKDSFIAEILKKLVV